MGFSQIPAQKVRGLSKAQDHPLQRSRHLSDSMQIQPDAAGCRANSMKPGSLQTENGGIDAAVQAQGRQGPHDGLPGKDTSKTRHPTSVRKGPCTSPGGRLA
jgi:hypothetical protein